MLAVLADVLAHELFGTAVSVAELLVALVSLFGGGYVGARSGGVARMRIEDRRQLLDEYLPDLINIVRGPDPTTHKIEIHYLTGDDRYHPPLVWAESATDLLITYETADNIVELLPWLDRYEWERFAKCFPLESAEVLRNYRRSGEWDELPGPLEGTDVRDSEYLNQCQLAAHGEGAPLDDASDRLREHLRYRLRPSIWRTGVVWCRAAKLAPGVALATVKRFGYWLRDRRAPGGAP